MVSVQEQLTETGDPAVDSPIRGDWWWVPGAITVITILSVMVVTLSQLHLGLLLTDTTTTGGDMGAHIAMPKYLESLMTHGHLTGWYPGWYDGFPLYTFYFALPDALIAFVGWIIPYTVAFKLGNGRLVSKSRPSKSSRLNAALPALPFARPSTSSKPKD